MFVTNQQCKSTCQSMRSQKFRTQRDFSGQLKLLRWNGCHQLHVAISLWIKITWNSIKLRSDSLMTWTNFLGLHSEWLGSSILEDIESDLEQSIIGSLSLQERNSISEKREQEISPGSQNKREIEAWTRPWVSRSPRGFTVTAVADARGLASSVTPLSQCGFGELLRNPQCTSLRNHGFPQNARGQEIGCRPKCELPCFCFPLFF